MNINRSWDSTCILGFGAHAELKLLPALKEVGLNIGGVVSSKSDLKIS